PQSAEDHDAGHVQGPTGEFVAAHLRFAHGVEEELKIPSGASQRGEKVVGEQRSVRARQLAARRQSHFFAGSVGYALKDVFFFPVHGLAADQRGEVLTAGLVADVENHTPEEIGGETAEKDDNQHGKPLPKRGGTVVKGNFFYGISGG